MVPLIEFACKCVLEEMDPEFTTEIDMQAPTSHNLNKQDLPHHPDTMALPSGIYTIQNVKYRNWAMLLNANEGEVVAGISASTNVGEKVCL
jgi:hypothetical protein